MNVKSPIDEYVKSEKDARDFVDLLSKITYASPEARKLWREIYENANDDRNKASILFTDLYTAIASSPESHILQGKQLSMYLERMNKANDQLLKLAELIHNASEADEAIDAEALYDEISGKK